MMKRRLALTGLVLSACGQVPQPFRGAAKVTSDLAIVDVPSAVGIAVVPLIGAPQPFNDQLAQAVAAELGRREIPAEAVTDNRGLGFSLIGDVIGTDEQNGVATLSIRWSLRSRRGADTGGYTQQTSIRALAWRQGDAAEANRIGRDAADVVVAMIEGSGNLTTGPAALPAAEPRRPAPPSYASFAVKPADGAPGDGREALQSALVQALLARGVKHNEDSPDVVLLSRVDVTPAAAGGDFVEIAWRAITQDGRDIGEAKLNNTVPRGSLSGRWGPTAFTIVEAALPDILEILAVAPRL
jgi:hypothetical protein